MGWTRPKVSKSKNPNEDGKHEFYIWWEEDLDTIILYEGEIREMLNMLEEAKQKEEDNANRI